jgi:hemoglobin-like flavoprotein
MVDEEKVNYVNTIFPMLSEKGQRYLQRIAQAMLFIQDPALSPIRDDQERRKEDETRKN